MKNLVGTVLPDGSRWTVLSYAGKRGKNPLWRSRCECGEVRDVLAFQLVSGRSRSCGCLAGELAAKRIKEQSVTHGLSRSRTHNCWCYLKQRTGNENNQAWADYGGRGIVIEDPRWFTFDNFLADMGECPEGMTIDRINNERGYCKDNCRWSHSKEQGRNKRNNRILEHAGRRLCVAEWAEETGVSESLLRARINRLGWSVERAITTPVASTTRK